MFLFHFSYSELLGKHHPYPRVITTPANGWPRKFLLWANLGEVKDLEALAGLKQSFFQDPKTLGQYISTHLPKDHIWFSDKKYPTLFGAIYGALWVESTEGIYNPSSRAEPMTVIESLRAELVIT